MKLVMITSAKEFIRLRTSEDKEDYDRAAMEEAPSNVWWELVRDHPEMRSWVAHNKTVPLEVLETLAGDADPAVRGVVARKRKASPEILARLAEDPDSGVRFAVACNRSTPPRILRLLLADDWEAVAKAARERLGP